MAIFIASSLILLGFLLLIKGANWMVYGATVLAKKSNISDLAIGLTVVAFGTSAPELVVNLVASIDGQSDIIFGNIIGSNNFNLFVILSIVGLIYPISVQSSTVWREIPISLFAALIVLMLANEFTFQNEGRLTRLDGLVLFLLFLAFLYYVFRQLKAEDELAETVQANLPNWKIWGYLLLGLGGLIVGGRLVVTNAVEIATIFGVSQQIIGLTIVAAGTSLPELVTSVVAALKRNSSIAIGNVIGSNIFNLLLILSVSSFARPIVYNVAFNMDLGLLIGGTIFLFIAMFSGQKKKLDRWEAGVLLIGFVVYTVYLIQKEL